MKNCIILSFLLSLVAMTCLAIPAKRVQKNLTLADGSTVVATLTGDENGHWYVDDQGRALSEDSEGVAHYMSIYELDSRNKAKTERAAIRNKARKARMAKRHITRGFTDDDFEGFIGKKKGVAILVNFSDTKFTYTQEDFNALANEEGYTNEYGAIGSVHDYYLDQSYNKFNLTFDVVGPVNLDKPYSYYGKNTGDDDLNAPEMIVECCQAVDDEVDFTEYDWDDDGVVEEVFVLYAGYGEATGGANNTIWPHMWTLTDASHYNDLVPKNFQLDDVFIDVYACSNELYNSFGTTEMGLGVICHEFSHCLGLPDLYDTSYSHNFGMGEWDILDSGSYNGPMGIGWVPAGYSSYERNYAGWLKYTELKTNRRVLNQKPLTSRGNAYVIYNDSCRDEYYLLENRALEGWDAFLPGEGLLIVHVDYDPNIWAQNSVNTTGWSNDHQRLTVFHASNSNRGGNEAYPYNGNDSLTDNSVPAATLYNPNIDGSYLMHKPITQITRNEETGYVSFMFKNENNGVVGIEELAFPDDEMVDVYTLDGMKMLSGIPSGQIDGLRPGTYILRNRNGESRKMYVK